jgi:hypothetical protein
MGDLSDIERRQIIVALLAGAYVMSTCTLLGVPRATVSKVIAPFMNHGEAASVKRKNRQK